MASVNRIANLARRTQTTSRGLASKDRIRDNEQKIEKQALFYSLSQIKPRPNGDTRELNPEHIIMLAESINAIGLLEPVVIDNQGHLLAGGHRIAAYRLLNKSSKGRIKLIEEVAENASRELSDGVYQKLEELEARSTILKSVPVRVIDFNAEEDQEKALAIEAAENTQRRDYTAKEVLTIYQKLRTAGYIDRRGKPKKGEKPVKPMIASIIGKSLRTVERMLSKKEQPQVSQEQQALKQLEKALRMVSKANPVEGSAFEKLNRLLGSKKLLGLLQEVGDELEQQEI